MKFSNRNNNLSRVELDDALIESFVLLEYFVKLSPVDEGHHEVEACVGLKKVLHSAKERVICLKKNVFLKGS